MTTIRVLVATAVKKGWEMTQLEVNNAFLHGDLHEDIYMKIPTSLNVSDPNLVCKLSKSLYGLKQASREWHFQLSTALIARGYQFSKNDTSLFYKRSGSLITFLAVCVDDILVTGNDTMEITVVKHYLDCTFKIKDLWRLHYFLGIEFNYVQDGIVLSQTKFILDMLTEFDCSSLSSVVSPLDSNTKLAPKVGSLLDDPSAYWRLVGKLNFLTNT